MLIYPSRESKTQLTFLPPFSLALVACAVIAYVVVFQPRHEAYNRDLVDLKKHLLAAVADEVDRGKIDYAVIEKVRRDPSILTQQDYAHLSFDVKNSYRALIDLKPPLIELKRSPSVDRHLLAVTPHGFWILLLAAIFLPISGFIFEHLYHSLIFAVIYVATAVAIPLLHVYFPTGYWPDAVFVFSFSVAVMVLLGWFVAPTAVITFELKVWLIKGVQHQVLVPASVIPLIFFTGFIVDGLYGNAYSHLFQLQSLAAIPILAVGFALLLIPISTRESALEKEPHTIINGKLTEVELLLGQEKAEAARDILNELINESLDMEQVMRVADLAWQTNQRSICERCYLKALRSVLPTRSFQKILPIVEIMTYRHLAVPASSLVTTVELGLKEKHFNEVKNLLPYVNDHPDVTREDRDRILDLVVDYNLEVQQADTEVLMQIRKWLGDAESAAPIIEKINHFFQRKADERTPVVSTSFTYQVNRHADVELLQVASDYVRLQVKGTKPQNVPWTAILAIWGSHLTTGKRGYRGCIFIRFKRKIFGCHFGASDVLITDDHGQRSSFEDAWAQLRSHTPEDVPFKAFDDFDDVADVDEHIARSQEYLTTSLR